MSGPASKNNANKTTSIILLIVLSLIWGTSFILMKRGLTAFTPGEVGAIRVVAAMTFLLPFALTRLHEINRRDYWKLFFSGMMGIFIPAFLFATAQTRMDSAITGILNSLTPICTLLVGAIFFDQRFRVRALTGIIIGLAGTVILILSRTGGQIGGVNLYALLVIVACLCYGINVNFVKFRITELKALTITSVALLLIGPFALVYLLFFTSFTSTVSANPGSWKPLAFLVLLGIMSTSIATLLFNRLIKISTPLFASSSTYIIPIVAVLWGLADQEKLAAGHFVGMAGIIAGVYIANRK
jgi:drug/metabolite transporter (DMT)-like permease